MKFVPLRELTITPKGDYGLSVPVSENIHGKYSYLSISDILTDGSLDHSHMKKTSELPDEKYLLQPNDIVFARTGRSTGKNYFYDANDGQLVFASFLIRFRLDPQKVNPLYVKYYCQSNYYKRWIQSLFAEGERGHINAREYGNMPVLLPDRSRQDFLADLFSLLDENIRILERIKNTLLLMAESIFATLFIQQADPSWKTGCLSDCVIIKHGRKHRYLSEGDVPVYGSGGIIRYVDQSLYDQESILIPRKGSLNHVFYVNEPFWPGDTMFYSQSKQPYMTKYLYHYLKCQDLYAMNSGSVIPSLTAATLNNLIVIIPPEEKRLQFDSVVSPIYLLIKKIENEINAIQKIKDSLLRKYFVEEIPYDT